MIIAVDGPAASGKGTIARALAAHFGVPHLDTGLLYRAVGARLLLMGGNPDVADHALRAVDFPESLLTKDVLRTAEIGSIASRVSVHPGVRQALKQRQVAFAHQPGGALLDGRDIGTVIAPDADAKLYVTASARVRAGRRLKELGRAATPEELDAYTRELEERDQRDMSRAEAPLKRAEGAALLDTSDLTIDEAVQQAIALVEAQLSRRSD